MTCYTEVFNFLCKSNKGSKLYARLQEMLVDFGNSVAAEAEGMDNEEALMFFRRRWVEYSFACRPINGMLMYLNRTWIRQRKSTTVTVHEVTGLADLVWYHTLFVKLKEPVVKAMLRLIERDRSGEHVDHAIVADTVACFVRLGEVAPESESMSPASRGAGGAQRPVPHALVLYKRYFEERFLQATEVYYNIEASQFLEKNGVTAYMEKVDDRIQDEQNRCRLFLHKTTEPELLHVLDTVLIAKHKTVLQEQFGILLKQDQRDKLALCFRLLHRIRTDGVEPLAAVFERFVLEQGSAMLEEVPAETRTKPDVYVKTLLVIYRRFQDLLETAFLVPSEAAAAAGAGVGGSRAASAAAGADAGGGRAAGGVVGGAEHGDRPDPMLAAARDKAFRVLLSCPSVSGASAEARSKAGAVTDSPAHLLAKYTDLILRKGPHHIADDAEMDRTLTDVVSLFQFLPDRDVFMVTYQRLLCKRLISGSSAQQDYESSVIARLRGKQGFDFCSKLSRMMQDMDISQDANSAFLEYCDAQGKRPKIAFQMLVLAQGIWPITSPKSGCILPPVMEEVREQHAAFYKSKWHSRVLTHLHNLAKVEVMARYAMKGRLRLSMTAQQASAIMLFDSRDNDCLTWSTLIEGTGMAEAALKVALLSLLRVRVLIGSKGSDHLEWTDDTTFTVNRKVTSKRPTLACNVPVETRSIVGAPAPVAQVEAEHVQKMRIHQLKAAITRIMKARKELSQAELVAEATQQVTKWFRPQVATINTAIDALIDGEYIERVMNEDGTPSKRFSYLA